MSMHTNEFNELATEMYALAQLAIERGQSFIGVLVTTRDTKECRIVHGGPIHDHLKPCHPCDNDDKPKHNHHKHTHQPTKECECRCECQCQNKCQCHRCG